jgi:hypothetical protein
VLVTLASGVYRVLMALDIPVGVTAQALRRLYDVPGQGSFFIVGLSLAQEGAALMTLGLVRPWREFYTRDLVGGGAGAAGPGRRGRERPRPPGGAAGSGPRPGRPRRRLPRPAGPGGVPGPAGRVVRTASRRGHRAGGRVRIRQDDGGPGALGLVPATDGRVLLDGRDITRMSRAQLRAARHGLALVHEVPAAALDPPLTVGESVAEPPQVHGTAPRPARPPGA